MANRSVVLVASASAIKTNRKKQQDLRKIFADDLNKMIIRIYTYYELPVRSLAVYLYIYRLLYTGDI